MIVTFTGHRPDKLGGYKLPNPTYNYVCQQIEKNLLELKPDTAISGMALGVDQWAAFICYKLKIPFMAAIPFKGQESAWPNASQQTYHNLLKKAYDQTIVCEGSYSAKKMQIRNEFMTDRCDVLIAIFNGSPGGTGNCINYAKSLHKK